LKTLRIYFLYALYTSIFINSQTAWDFNTQNDNSNFINNSGINSKTVWEYYYVPGEDNSFRDSGFRSLSYFYDEFGRVTEYTKHHVYAPLTSKERYTYNKFSKVSNIIRLNSNSDVIEVIDLKYSKKGNLKKEIHSAYYNSVRVGVYFTIIANIKELELFSMLQDELQIDPKLESYMITVNITDNEELNQYVVIGDEAEPSSMRFSWSQLSQESQKGLLSYKGTNRKENTYKIKFVSEVSYKYDKNGNLKERAVYSTSGDLLRQEKYRYNAKNLKTNYNKYNENGRVSTMESYNYDDTGMLIESIGMEPSGRMVSRLLYKYNESGMLDEKLWIEAGGKVNRKFKYTYDNANRIKEEIKFRGEDEIESRHLYNYDTNGNIIEKIRIDINNQKEKLWKYVYE